MISMASMFHSVGRCSGSDIPRSGLNVDEDVGSFRVRDKVLLYVAVFSSTVDSLLTHTCRESPEGMGYEGVWVLKKNVIRVTKVCAGLTGTDLKCN